MKLLLSLALTILSCSVTAAQSSDSSRTRVSFGASAGFAPVIGQISLLARTPVESTRFHVAFAGAIGYQFADDPEREHHSTTTLVDGGPYATMSAGLGFDAVTLTCGFGVRADTEYTVDGLYKRTALAAHDGELYVRGTRVVPTMVMTAAAHVFITDGFGARVEFLELRWPLVGVEIVF